ALFAGNLMAVVRPPERQREEGNLERAPVGRSLLYAGLGLVAAVWALASLISGGGPRRGRSPSGSQLPRVGNTRQPTARLAGRGCVRRSLQRRQVVADQRPRQPEA